jgi:16S rRNA G527 N7-methylase RsmG
MDCHEAVPAKLTRLSGQQRDFRIACADSAAARLGLDRCQFHYWLDLGNSGAGTPGCVQ